MRIEHSKYWAGLALAALAACAAPGSADSKADPSEPSNDRKPTTDTMYSMSRIMITRGQDAQAEGVLTKLIEDEPRFLPAYADLADLYLRADRPDSAIEVLKAGVAVAPEDAVLRNNLGMCRLMQGRYEEALDDFTAAAAGVPKDARARANMAVALGMLGRLDESLAVYLQLVPEADAHHNLAVLCDARKDWQRAEQEYAIAETLRSSGRAPAGHPGTKP
jgi:protein O-GlcNAc transferase